MSPDSSSPARPADSVEAVVFEALYTPISLEAALATSETRGRIRKLPVTQLYYAIQSAEDADVARLLPHITEEQWTNLLDLDLWHGDQTSGSQLMAWTRYLSRAEPAVARKLWRATSEELWELLFREELEVFGRTEEDEFEGDPPPDRSSLQTQDGLFLVILPEQPEKERLLRDLIGTLSGLDSGRLSYLLAQSRTRTSVELQEEAYQQSRRRLDQLGFQDYFDAIEIFGYWPVNEPLPPKSWDEPVELSTLPLRLTPPDSTALLLFDAMASIRPPSQSRILEELFFACNKLMAARRVWPADLEAVRRGIREALLTINLGLDCWAGSAPARAVEGIRKHFLVSFYQYGASRLQDLQAEAVGLLSGPAPEGSPLEALIEGLSGTPPVLTELIDNRLVEREFVTAADIELALELARKGVADEDGWF